jgi:RNA polymerase sigma factor (sigma-70 family)
MPGSATISAPGTANTATPGRAADLIKKATTVSVLTDGFSIMLDRSAHRFGRSDLRCSPGSDRGSVLMTGAIPRWRDVTDGELARAAAEGDRQAFAEIYDRYSDRLYDFCVGTIGDRDAAADCVQDAFCVAATDLKSLREPDRLRPWLYSIVRNHAMRRLRHRYREVSSDEIPDMASHEVGPDMMAGQSDLARLVADAAGGLSDRDRELLELHYRHELDGPELAEALGVTLTSANTMVFRLRQTIERSLGALLVARGTRAKTSACSALATMLEGWDGQLTVLIRKRIARHIDSCHTCQQEQRRQVNPVALLGGAPAFIPAPDRLREQTLDRVQLTAADSNMPNTAVDPSGPTRIWPRIALLVGVPLAFLAMTVAWFAPREASIAPTIQVETNPSSAPPSLTIGSATNAPAATRPMQPPPTSAARTQAPAPRSPTSPELRTPQPTPDESTPEPLPQVGSPEPTPAETTQGPPVEGGDQQNQGEPITEGKQDSPVEGGDQQNQGEPITEGKQDSPVEGGDQQGQGEPITEGKQVCSYIGSPDCPEWLPIPQIDSLEPAFSTGSYGSGGWAEQLKTASGI